MTRVRVAMPTYRRGRVARRSKFTDQRSEANGYTTRPLAGSALAGRSPDPDGGTDPRGRVVRNTPIRVVPEPLAPTSVCGAFGPSGRSAWGCRGSGGDGFQRGAGRAGRDRRQAVPGPSGGGVPDHVRPRVRRAGRGRARQRAREPVVRGTDVASWVMSVNVHRRHLDASQRALLASRLSALSSGTSLWRSSPTGFQGVCVLILPGASA